MGKQAETPGEYQSIGTGGRQRQQPPKTITKRYRSIVPGGYFEKEEANPEYSNSPDFLGAAREQNFEDRQNNRIDQSNPWATSSWTTGPDGRQVQTNAFAGPMAGANASLMQQWADNNAKPMDDGSAARDQATTAAYDQMSSRLNPMWNQRESHLGNSLANQGLDTNSQAYRAASQQFGQQRNDAYSSAMNNAIGIGNTAGNDVFRNNMAARMAPMAGLQSMQGLTQQANVNRINPTDYMGAANSQSNRELGIQNQGSQQAGSALAAGGTALAALLSMMSDERTKDNVHRYSDEAIPGVQLATWEYKHEPGQTYLGVIAQDLEAVAPHLVFEVSGIKFVDPAFAPVAIPKDG